jgi:hypothetical protein
MAQYEKNSPYYKTSINANYLDIFNKRNIPALDNDITYEIEPQYAYRPDLLAYDLYGSSKLWWVFAIRNMESIKDPVFDFLPGVQIKLPQKSTLDAVLGK